MRLCLSGGVSFFTRLMIWSVASQVDAQVGFPLASSEFNQDFPWSALDRNFCRGFDLSPNCKFYVSEFLHAGDWSTFDRDSPALHHLVT